MGIATVNPSTGEIVKTFEPITDQALDNKLNKAAKAFRQYQQIPIAQRAHWLQQAADRLEAHKEQYGRLMTVEMGKPIKSAIAEVEKCAWVCRFYADHAEAFLQPTPIATDATESYVIYQPLGAILAVMPWNFPFWQVFRFAAPALMVGNVGLLKHASNVPQSALAIEQLLLDAGFPEGVFQTLLIGADRVAPLMADSRIAAATLTGSEPAGMSLAIAAGQNLKKVVLELGGSDPFIVMPTADLDAAVAAAVTSRMVNNGQTCIAAKRFIVHEAIADAFTHKLTEKFAALKVGDPLLPETDVGPLATPKILQDLDRQVRETVLRGAKVVIGGHPLDRPGDFYAPTILTDIPHHSPGRTEEFFGPVALLFRVMDLDGAIDLANSTQFGLGASAWTNDLTEKARFIQELQAGSVFVNGMVKSDPRLPFGGIKRSGIGRELGREGLLEFANIKTIWVQ